MQTSGGVLVVDAVVDGHVWYACLFTAIPNRCENLTSLNTADGFDPVFLFRFGYVLDGYVVVRIYPIFG